jgi:hypothetical protein
MPGEGERTRGLALRQGSIAVQVRGITERDIDLLLLEQLVLDSSFRDGFLAEVGLASCGRLTAAARSVNTTTGESDLELTLVEGQRVTKVLVENKVDALLQPRQAERYAERAAAYRAAGDCDQVVTVLVAPESYAGAAAGFDRTVTYESVRRLLGGEEADDRARYKHFLLREAIERCASGWVLVPDEAATAFWLRYWELSKTVAPQLNMRRPEEKPATSNFIYFWPTALARGVALIHKVPYGDVDLQFEGKATRAASFESKHGGHLRPGMHIERANKSLVVRMQVPRIVLKAPFEQSEAAVRQALDAAAQLLKWYTRWVRPRASGRAGRRR